MIITQPTYNWSETVETFEGMNLKQSLLRGIFTYGFEKPSEIQQKDIRPIIMGRDVIAQAQSGTGKTISYVIGMLQVIDTKVNHCQALILVPTRELAQQIDEIERKIGKFMFVRSQLCVGGKPYKQSLRNLKKGVHVVVGTIGRVFWMINNGHLETNHLRLFVLDEADLMIYNLHVTRSDFIQWAIRFDPAFSKLPENIQWVLISSTFSEITYYYADFFIRNPVLILVEDEELTLEGISQYYKFSYDAFGCYDEILYLYENLNIDQSIIFYGSNKGLTKLERYMESHNFAVATITGAIDQPTRDHIMREFNRGSIRVLLTQRLLGRGIDFKNVSLVINYILSSDTDEYLHRIGRSGRFGRKGLAISYILEYEYWKIQHLEEIYGTKINELPEDLSNLL